MSESSEARRKRLKAMLSSAQDAEDQGGSGGGGSGGGLANPFADEGGPSTNSGPFTFFRCGIWWIRCVLLCTCSWGTAMWSDGSVCALFSCLSLGHPLLAHTCCPSLL